MLRTISTAALVATFAGCIIPLPSVTSDERPVQTVSDPSKAVEFIEPVVWLDRPGPLEMRVLDGGDVVDGRDIPGGLAIAKSAFNIVPAAAYVDVGLPGARMHVMKLDQVFMALEGTDWKKHTASGAGGRSVLGWFVRGRRAATR